MHMIQSLRTDTGANRQLSSFLTRLGNTNITKQSLAMTKEQHNLQDESTRTNGEKPTSVETLHSLLLEFLPSDGSTKDSTRLQGLALGTDEVSLAMALMKIFKGLGPSDEYDETPIDSLLPFDGKVNTDPVLRPWNSHEEVDHITETRSVAAEKRGVEETDAVATVDKADLPNSTREAEDGDGPLSATSSAQRRAHAVALQSSSPTRRKQPINFMPVHRPRQSPAR